MQFLDRYGWPVERVEGRPVLNFFRLLIHTCKIKRGRFQFRHKLGGCGESMSAMDFEADSFHEDCGDR